MKLQNIQEFINESKLVEIGKTKSGKSVYNDDSFRKFGKSDNYKDFSKEDHAEAAQIHHDLFKEEDKKNSGGVGSNSDATKHFEQHKNHAKLAK